jgi:hypothetical protein
VKKTDHGIVVIVIYVNDLIITGDNDADISDLKKLLKFKFEMKDLGELRYFLGIEVIKSPKGIWLLQRQYTLNKLAEYGMTSCKPISIPLKQNVKLSANEGDLVEDTTMYRRIVGVATLAWARDHGKGNCKGAGQREARELSQKEARELKQEEARELSQEEARESHHILPGVQESARECEGVNTHTPKATPTWGDGVSVDS